MNHATKLMAENDFEKTEDATPRRKREERESGNVARSTDLTAALILLASVLMLHLLGMRVLGGMREAMVNMLTAAHATNPATAGDMSALGVYSVRLVAFSMAPLMLAIMAIGVVANLGQVGLLLTPKPLMPQFSRLSPLRGVKNLFNLRAAMRLVMSLAKVIVIAALAVWVVMGDLPLIMHIGELEAPQAFAASAQLVYALALKLAALLILLALLDFAYQRFQHAQDMKMSKHEVKQEMKEMEGDPLIKQRRSRVARQLALQRIAHDVPRADVIVTNPTHYSIAIRYDSATMTAPKVIAKGADFLALRIRQIAVAHGIPIVERKPLARALYHGVDVGQEIPPQHYAAIAEILAYVYRMAEPETAAV